MPYTKQPHTISTVQAEDETSPEKVLWCSFITHQMSGAKANVHECRQFFFSEHFKTLCLLMNLPLELLQAAAMDSSTPMNEPSRQFYFIDPNNLWRRKNHEHLMEKQRKRRKQIKAGNDVVWVTGNEVQHVSNV